MSDVLRFYADNCPNCDSWNVRIVSEEPNKTDQGWDVVVYCRECGFEWNDFIEDVK